MLAAFTLAGGAWIFLAVILVWLFAVIYGLYTRTGSGINVRSWSNPYIGQAGGQRGSLDRTDASWRTMTRGTR